MRGRLRLGVDRQPSDAEDALVVRPGIYRKGIDGPVEFMGSLS